MLVQFYTRRASRRRVDLLCQLIRSDYDEPIRHRITDLSAFGAWVRTTFPMTEGERVVLVFTPPGGTEVTIFADVKRIERPSESRRRRSRGMGLEFQGMERHERAALLFLLRDLPDDTELAMQFARALN